MCLTNGSLEAVPWKECMNPSARNCPDPPLPPDGGLYSWNATVMGGGRTPFLTDIDYTCESGKRFRRTGADGNEELYDKKTITCLWSMTYTDTTVRVEHLTLTSIQN